MEIKTPGNGRLTVLIITTVVSFLAPFMSSAVNIALPEIGEELGMNAVLLGWVATAFLLASAALVLPFGRLADIYGRRTVFTIGTIIFSAGSILCALANYPFLLIGARALQGIGAGMIYGTAVAMLTSAYPPGERGRVLGINAASMYGGLSLGPLLGGVLTDLAGWRSIFLVGFAVSFLTALIVLAKLKGDWAEARGEKFDYGGSVLLAAFLITFISGLTDLPAIPGVALLAGSAVAGFTFVTWENRTPSPLLRLDLLRHNRAFAFSNVASLINYAATSGLTFLLSLYLQYNKGLAPEAAGLVLVANPAMQSLFSPIAGRLSDRVEPRLLASAGMAVTTLGLGLLVFVGEDTPIAYLLVALMIIGFGFGMFAPPNMHAVMTSVSRRWYGVASATMAASRFIGLMLSMGIAMLIIATVTGRVEITPEHHDAFLSSVRVALITFTALCTAGVFASLAAKNHHRADGDSEGPE